MAGVAWLAVLHGSPSGLQAGHPDSLQRVDRWPHDPLPTQPVAGQLQQDTRCVVLERPGEQEAVELLAFRTHPAERHPSRARTWTR